MGLDAVDLGVVDEQPVIELLPARLLEPEFTPKATTDDKTDDGKEVQTLAQQCLIAGFDVFFVLFQTFASFGQAGSLPHGYTLLGTTNGARYGRVSSELATSACSPLNFSVAGSKVRVGPRV